jgi:hypothetical protein
MVHAKHFFYVVFISCLTGTVSCSQNNSTTNSSTLLFVGSTPCNTLTRSQLEIPETTKCEFVKWELTINVSSATFRIVALYGESKPNTNGFMGGGQMFEGQGKYLYQSAKDNPKNKLYYLYGENFKSTIILREMDENILHFADANKKFLVGNGGWGYVLNRMHE